MSTASESIPSEEQDAPATPKEIRSSIRVAVVCQSNVNRSMEAHDSATKLGFQVTSYGAGRKVKLPGLTADNPNEFEFGTSYDAMFRSLQEQNAEYYSRNGILQMLDRDRKLKFAPQRFQDENLKFDVVITFDQRVFERVIDDLRRKMAIAGSARARNLSLENQCVSRGFDSLIPKPVHVINLETIDNHREAKARSQNTMYLLQMLYEDEESWQDRIEEILLNMEFEMDCQVLHTVLFY